jgi:hypothetical protein
MGLVEQEVPEVTPANEEVFPREETTDETDQSQVDHPPVTEETSEGE